MRAIYKTLIEWYSSNGDSIPTWLQRKAENDDVLKHLLCKESEITELLSSRNNIGSSFESRELEERILASLNNDTVNDSQDEWVEQPSNIIRNVSFTLGGVAAAVLLSFVIWSPRSDSNDGSPVIAEVSPVGDNSLVASSGLNIDLENWKNPLDQEIEYVVNDAKGVLRFFATNFVPEEYISTVLPEEITNS